MIVFFKIPLAADYCLSCLIVFVYEAKYLQTSCFLVLLLNGTQGKTKADQGEGRNVLLNNHQLQPTWPKNN